MIDTLKTQSAKYKESLQKLESDRQQLVQQLNGINEQILRLQGAILACGELEKLEAGLDESK